MVAPPRQDARRIVLRGGTVIVGPAPAAPLRADILVEAGHVSAVGDIPPLPDDHVIDCSGRFVLPGFIDTHSHTDGLLGDTGVQGSLLRQGVTTVITGQDGVSFAPGDGTYASEYFAAINGDYPTYTGGGVGAYLATLDGTSRVNAATLIPAGTLRWEACGRSTAPANTDQLAAMVDAVDAGLRDGAVGLSTGLDYVPGIFQDAAELAALCVPVATAHSVYVSHMRGGYEHNTAVGIDEIIRIADTAGAAAGTPLPVHVSHFHADADIVAAQLDSLATAGTNATFDAYPYTSGCTLLSMPLLPPTLNARPVDEVVATLADPVERARLREDWFPKVEQNASLGRQWATAITFAHVDAAAFSWLHGLTIAAAAEQAGTDPITLALDVLHASRLRTNVVMAVPHPRTVPELAQIFARPEHMAGSDGIFIGAHPHPRARGTFTHYLRQYVRESKTWTWPQAVAHLSTSAADRFSLGNRGRIVPGAVADLIVVDPATVTDRATYEEPMRDSVGIDDVLVGGVPVLADGVLQDATPGRGIRRAAHPGRHSARRSRNHFRSPEHSPQPPERHRPMTKHAIHTSNAPQPAGPYSQGIVANGFLYTAGFGPQDPTTGKIADGVADQTRQVLRNVSAVLSEHNLALDDAVKTTVHLADLADFAEFNTAYVEFFNEPYPVRTTVGSQLAGILVEIDVVVALRDA